VTSYAYRKRRRCVECCIWALGGISSLIGAVATDATIRRIGLGPAMMAACFLSGLAMFFVPLAKGATLTAALLLIFQQLLGDGAAMIYQINQVTLRPVVTQERLRGRVNASAELFGLGAMLAGLLLGGLWGGIIGVRTMLFLSAFGTIFSMLWVVFSPVRALRTLPKGETEPSAWVGGRTIFPWRPACGTNVPSRARFRKQQTAIERHALFLRISASVTIAWFMLLTRHLSLCLPMCSQTCVRFRVSEYFISRICLRFLWV
jgi:MFS family permease